MEPLRNFSWIIDGFLAGMAGVHVPVRDDNHPVPPQVEALRQKGIGALLCLTEGGIDEDAVAAHGFHYQWVPIPDMTAPTMLDLDECIEFIEEQREQNRPTAVFCGAGMGRTGTVLAAYLVAQGQEPGEAIYQVRSRRPGSIETYEQEKAIADYAFYLRQKKKG